MKFLLISILDYSCFAIPKGFKPLVEKGLKATALSISMPAQELPLKNHGKILLSSQRSIVIN